MYKWKKEEAQKEVVDPEIVYAEKSGYYCDLCGAFIGDIDNRTYMPRYDSPVISKKISYYGGKPNILNGEEQLSLETVIPVIELRTMRGRKTADLCPACEADIMAKIARHSEKVLENLTKASRYDILYHQDNIDKLYEDNRDLRNENSRMREEIDALTYRHDD